MNKKIYIWGWWQGKNLGDNWILSTMKKIFGSDSAPLSTDILDFKTMGNGDFIICGGGGLFVHDVIPPWDKKVNIPYGVFGIGTEFGADKEKITDLYKNSHFFYVRDYMTLNKFHMEDKSLVIADVTFFDPLPISNGGNNILFIWRKNDLDISLYSKDKWKKYIGEYASIDRWRGVLLSFSNVIESSFDGTENENWILESMNNVGFIVSQRYHGIISAIQMGIPCVALDICPKIKSLMDDCGLSEYCIKIGEIDKFPMLYEKAMSNKKEIINKMKRFTKDNNSLVINAANLAISRINK